MSTQAATPSSELTEAKLLLLQRMLAGREASADDRFEPDNLQALLDGTNPPLSPEQQNVWLHTAMAAEVPLYNESITIHLKGPLDRVAMERSFNELLRRHDAWRTSFSGVGGDVSQVVHPHVTTLLTIRDISHLPAEEREQEALRIATADARKPIDCSRPPLFRVRGLKLAEYEHRFYLTLHHIIFDGVSICRVIVPELANIYRAFVDGREPDLPDVAARYGDYSVWRHRHAASNVVADQMEYWRRSLAGPLPVLQLPTDRPRPAMPTYRGSMERFSLSGELTEALKSLSRKEGVTLYMTLLAAFKVLLHRYSGQDDIIIGGVTDTRRHPKLQRVVGYFLNPVVLRTRPSGQLTFKEYLQQTRDAVAGALDASDIPFDRIVREFAPARNLSMHPLFQVFFSIQPPAPLLPGDFDLTQMDIDIGVAKFDLYLELEERTEGLIGRFIYSSDLFDAATIRRMVGHWRRILEGITRNPNCTLSHLPLLTDAEISQMLVVWNETSAVVPQLGVHQQFEAKAAQIPHAIAVTCNGRSCTYRDLNRSAAVVASRLRKLGVQEGSLVALAADRSLEMAAALLGILKTGGAYLPLDPQFPEERLKLIIEDARPHVLLTKKELLGKLPAWSAATVLCDDVFGCKENDIEIVTQSSVGGLAYVLYTSGSTGEPKGVEIPHSALVNLLASMQREPGFGDADRMLAVTTLSFDIAALEIFLPLISGGQLIIASSDVAADPTLLAKLIRDCGCTVMQATPAMWRALVESGWPGQKGLKMLCGGETLPRELADKLLARGSSLWNLYGPTETTIWSTLHRVEAGEGSVSIGKAIANTRTFILDCVGNPVPIGVTGELCIGGRGLARGYRNRKQLTKRRFVVSEVAPDERLYRTGDLARYRADGTIECLGRLDNQVKVRGFRIEVEEVESFLLKHPNVAAAAVKAWPDSSGEMSLTSYIVGRHGPAPSAAQLREFLQGSLPDYMVPSRYVALRQLPMTRNCKVDRNALPNTNDIQVARHFQEPRGNIECRLAAIWKDILGVKIIGARDNFFDLGGHSLLVAKLLRRIEAEFGISLSMAAVFYAPQLDELAARLQEVGIALPRIVAVQPNGSRPPLYWMGGGGTILPLAHALGPDQPFFDVLLDFRNDSERTPRFEALASEVVRGLRAHHTGGPYCIGGFCTHGILAYEVASQLRAQDQRVGIVIMLDSVNPVHFKNQLKRRQGLLGQIGKFRFHCAEIVRLRGNARRRYGWILAAHLMGRMGWLIGQPALTVAEAMLDASAIDYMPAPYDGDVALIQASRRPAGVDCQSGWETLVRGAFFSDDVSGNHEDFIQEPNVRRLAELILARMPCIERRVRENKLAEMAM
ncbi:MAG TPA: amino acid adenylation domain-containing protein [Pseudolabrys sp.]|nr:amino acid adenylation domain-containing protein [Pseudolabrys sp.]